MKIRRLAVVSTFVCATAIAFAPGSATGDDYVCPDHYQPALAFLSPNTDKNDNFIICVKEPPSNNQHVNTKDDKPQYTDDIV